MPRRRAAPAPTGRDRGRRRRRASPRAARCRRTARRSRPCARRSPRPKACGSARWSSSRRSDRAGASSIGRGGRSWPASGTGAAARRRPPPGRPVPAPPQPGRRRASSRSSRGRVRPGRCRSHSAVHAAPAAPPTSHRGGCRTRPRVAPDGSQPASPTRSTASAACSTSAAGSAPRGSSGTVGSVRSWARPQVAQSHICRGWTGSGPASSRAGKWSAAGWSPRSSTTCPSPPRHERHACRSAAGSGPPVQ